MAPFKYDQRTERVSIRLPHDLKNHVWAQARKQRISATDVIVEILRETFAGLPPAKPWAKGTTKPKKKEQKLDVFA